jgi:biopolymer transport protein ExbD
MRRFSQRNSLVTLNDINITPLLDLAFVLLIIFVITTPAFEPALALRLPVGSGAAAKPTPQDEVTVEVSPNGRYALNGKLLNGLRELEAGLRAAYRANTNMVVKLRADGKGAYQYPLDIIDLCRRNGITRFDLATDGSAKR